MMKKILPLFLCLSVFVLACQTLQPSGAPSPAAVKTAQPAGELPNSALVDVYDPARDPAEDLRAALPIAQREGKNIMLELGGDWCIWCKYMDEFYVTHPDVLQVRAENYVLIKVNVSEENDNAAFLSQYPPAAGYPHIYILDSAGKLLHSQDTVELEDGRVSYVPETFLNFLHKWAPAK